MHGCDEPHAEAFVGAMRDERLAVAGASPAILEVGADVERF